MNKYRIGKQTIDSVELKCLVVSRGVKVHKSVYNRFSQDYRLNVSPLKCDCMLLSDNTIVQLTDMAFHLGYLNGALSWNNLKLLRYASMLKTPFSLKIVDDKAALCYENEVIDFITLPSKTDFYEQSTSNGLSFAGNSVLQGLDWVAFQCLWPCEYALKGSPCEFCFSGAEFQALAQSKAPIPKAVTKSDFREIMQYAFKYSGCNSVQITGGSTFNGAKEAEYIKSYLDEAAKIKKADEKGEILLYITPPKDKSLLDDYFSMGADRVACSVEVWDESIARIVTPGKMCYSTRERHLSSLEYIANAYGPNKAFSNFIIGIESLETLKEGSQYLAQRGIIPAASIWMPMGKPVMDSMQAPDIDYYRAVKEHFAELYNKYDLFPGGGKGLNVCMEKDIWNYAKS